MVDDLLKNPKGLPPPSTRLCGLTSTTKAWSLASLSRLTDKPILVVLSTHAEARNLIDDLAFLGGPLSERIHYLPPLDFDFYRGLLPNPETLTERNTTLFHALNDAKRRIFITTVHAVLQKNMPPDAFLRTTTLLEKEQELNRDRWIAALVEAGYQRQPATYDAGVFSVRGGTVDVFSPNYPNPVRLEFFGDFIEEMRFFEPQSQRSLEAIDKAAIIPVGLALLPQGQELEKAAGLIKDRFDAIGVPKAKRDEVLETLANGQNPADYAFLFPLLSGGSSSVMDFFPAEKLVFWDGEKKALELAKETELPKLHKNAQLFEEAHFPVSSRESLFVSAEEFEAWVHSPSYYFEDFSAHHGDSEIVVKSEAIDFTNERASAKSKSQASTLEAFASRFRTWMDAGTRIQVICHTKNHADRMSLLFEPYGIRTELHPEGGNPPYLQFEGTDFQKISLWVGYISESVLLPEHKIALLSEEEIFGKKKRTGKARRSDATQSEKILAGFRDLKVGDYVVHKDFGIGRYLGLKSMDFLGLPNDYVLLEYKDADKLYIPVYRLNILQKYQGGEGAEIALDKLGAEQWSKARAKAERAIAELAGELLNIQARRKLIPAHAFGAPTQDYHQFEMEFPFDETPDQLKAIQEVGQDLGKSHPMDRLLCGDVGYGKTEVGMRASARAVLEGKQVAVLVPTTVLAFQHFESFKNRFKNSGARVEMVSRLRSSKEIKAALEAVKEGKVDILIGTHRLLSSDVQFKDLGLIVIDEEHRFGVAHKEKLRRISESVHLLSMTATPIPRTLNMAMAGIKDISIITTPPPDRLSVRTFVCRRTEEIIAEAISNELLRDGQVFFLHNRVESIFRVGEEIRRVLPKVKYEIVHGQMEPGELEKKMLGFYRGDFQILLTTAIIESGLDIPRANTILIDQAQNLGLAQLYQLRGRVGRSDKRAYCYLLVNSETQMTADAKQRLQVIQRYTELGSGFHIASHDLDIRGAGNLLGAEQSGHITAIGIDLYMELLEQAIQELQGEAKKSQVEPEINLKVAAYFPESYLPDISERVLLYRRLSSVTSEEKLSEIESEIRDRFGVPTEEVLNLLGIMTLKLHLKRMHVLRMSCGPKKTSLHFAATTPASPEKLVKLVQAKKDTYTVTPDGKLVFVNKDTSLQGLIQEVQRLSELLA